MQEAGLQADISWRASAQSTTGAEGGNSRAGRESVALDRYRGRAFIAPVRMRPHILWVELL
jgi:hypothetical protein